MSSSGVYIVGRNGYNEFLTKSTDDSSYFGIADDAENLMESNINKLSGDIKEIISGNEFAFHHDINHNIWASGYNGNGECCTGHKQNLYEYHEIKYFKQKGIKIKKICATISSQTIFWITENNEVYGNGENLYHQLGTDMPNDIKASHSSPVLIKALTNQNIIDIRPSDAFSIALCSNSHTKPLLIVANWSRDVMIYIPDEISKLIYNYYTANKVLFTGVFPEAGGKDYFKTWSENDKLKNKNVNIEKIRVGKRHCLCLDSDGVVWSAGSNDKGQIGLGLDIDGHQEFKQIEYFVKNDIKIRDMECGWNHSVMVDYEGRVWTFGSNTYGQMGNIMDVDKVLTPVEIECFRDYDIEMIKCGVSHNYLRCDGNKHFLWGSNASNECLTDDNKNEAEPHEISKIILNKTSGKTIKDVFLGYDNTKLIVKL